MGLTLITGPANAAKAGAVLDRLRAVLTRDPVLVVPTSADAGHYSRELAGAGLVFGADVWTFGRLMADIARRCGVGARPIGRLTRERVVRACVADVSLSALAGSARGPGFAAALGDLFAELQRSLAGPGRFAAAVRAWGAAAPPHAAELAALYSAYHRRLEALEAVDFDGQARAALDALRADPRAWGGRPVFFYGFDEFTRSQLDAVETLLREADICVALPYEPGRAALAGSAETVELLKPLASEHVVLEARSEHYAGSARGALHHLERGLFEEVAARVPPNGAVRLLEAGGERAEAELVGASVLELWRDGMAFEDIAVLVRGQEATELTAQVLSDYGIPVARERRAVLASTRLGAGLLAFARAALGTGAAQDVVRWLRTPGKLAAGASPEITAARLPGAEERSGEPGAATRDVAAAASDLAGGPLAGPGAADRLEAAVLRNEARTAAEARRLWERGGGRPLAELDLLAAAAEEGAAAFLAALQAEADAIWTGPHIRRADVLSPDAEADARAAAALRSAVSELTRLAALDEALAGSPAELLEALAAVEVREGPAAAEGAPGVLLADPLAIRARRFRAVFVCGLQDGELPRRPQPEPFLDDDARRALATVSGLVLPRHEDTLTRERSLFYAAVSRPEEALFLSFRTSDEEGAPLQPSPFVDDVRSLFTDELWTGRGRRLLAEVTWPPAEAPTPHELRRAQAAVEERPDPAPLAAPSAPSVLAALAARDRESARGLEAFAACGVRWVVEQLLRPDAVDPDPEAMRRGSLVHAVLERTLRGLKARTGSARITPVTLGEALEEMHRAIAGIVTSGGSAHAKAAARALEVDLERYLRHEAECGAGYEPVQLEWGFGGDHDEAPALELDGVSVSGRVDRVDVGPAGAVVRDYKGRTVHAGARWGEDGRLQAALYALAVQERLGLDVAGALYQPIGRADQRPRGLVRDDVPGRYVNGDVVDAESFEAGLEEARAAATRAAAELRSGRIRPCPERCGYGGVCAYPGICRS
ncbi:PD-(D/E)XK nuclease family protein [Candidatus Solirubrobacter pratensis]|uniref:PD-(D/E)XK nuclease family protein n=1 Tax=Candidatus Solirubrobacter pratensis TaxID=1298857 RepID=UPI0003F879F5|nr:PD-(D/E)XK nuclease family protein [Candidatus Solirubrobacter pratensis]